MHQAIRTVNIHKGAEIRQGSHTTRAHFAFFELIEQAFLERFTRLFQGRPFRQDQAAAATIDLDHPHADGFAHHLRPTLLIRITFFCQASGRTDLGSRHESAQRPHRNDQAAFVIS